MDSEKKSVVIAVCGKEGSGKTSISAVMTKILMNDKNAKVLVIDVDPDERLAKVLGIKLDRNFYDIRKATTMLIKVDGETSKNILLSNLEDKVRNIIIQKGNMSFLAIGKLNKDKDFLKGNSLLQEVIGKLSLEFNYVIIDGEPEINVIKERVIKKVTHLVFVSDVSEKGISFVKTANEGRNELNDYESVGLILSRLKTKEEIDKVRIIKEIPLITYTIDNNELKNFDIAKNSILDLPEGNLIQYVRNGLSRLNV